LIILMKTSRYRSFLVQYDTDTDGDIPVFDRQASPRSLATAKRLGVRPIMRLSLEATQAILYGSDGDQDLKH
jgi:hypothetical protein